MANRIIHLKATPEARSAIKIIIYSINRVLALLKTTIWRITVPIQFLCGDRNYHVEDNGNFDGYINNLITCAVKKNNNLERIIAAPCMVTHAMDHSEKGNTILKIDGILALDKYEAELSPS